MTEIPAEPQELKHAGRLGSAMTRMFLWRGAVLSSYSLPKSVAGGWTSAIWHSYASMESTLLTCPWALQADNFFQSSTFSREPAWLLHLWFSEALRFSSEGHGLARRLFVANGVATEMLAFSRSSDCPCHLLRMWKVFCCHCHVNSHFWGSQCLETLMAKEKRGGENNQVMLVRQYCLLRLRTSSGQ